MDVLLPLLITLPYRRLPGTVHDGWASSPDGCKSLDLMLFSNCCNTQW